MGLSGLLWRNNFSFCPAEPSDKALATHPVFADMVFIASAAHIVAGTEPVRGPTPPAVTGRRSDEGCYPSQRKTNRPCHFGCCHNCRTGHPAGSNPRKPHKGCLHPKRCQPLHGCDLPLSTRETEVDSFPLAAGGNLHSAGLSQTGIPASNSCRWRGRWDFRRGPPCG